MFEAIFLQEKRSLLPFVSQRHGLQTSGRQRGFGAASPKGQIWHRKDPTLLCSSSRPILALRSLKSSGEHHIIVYRVQRSFVPLSGKELSGEKSWGDFVLADLSSIAGDTLPPPCWLLTPMEELWVDS